MEMKIEVVKNLYESALSEITTAQKIINAGKNLELAKWKKAHAEGMSLAYGILLSKSADVITKEQAEAVAKAGGEDNA